MRQFLSQSPALPLPKPGGPGKLTWPLSFPAWHREAQAHLRASGGDVRMTEDSGEGAARSGLETVTAVLRDDRETLGSSDGSDTFSL